MVAVCAIVIVLSNLSLDRTDDSELVSQISYQRLSNKAVLRWLCYTIRGFKFIIGVQKRTKFCHEG